MTIRQHELWWHDLSIFVGELKKVAIRPWSWSDYVVGRINAATARCIGRPKLGWLTIRSIGDVAMLCEEKDSFEFIDDHGERLAGERQLAVDTVVVDGAVWHPESGSSAAASGSLI